MVKVSIEVHHGTAQFIVAGKAQSIEQAMSLVTTRYPGSVAKRKFPIDSEGFLVEDGAASVRLLSLLHTSRN